MVLSRNEWSSAYAKGVNAVQHWHKENPIPLKANDIVMMPITHSRCDVKSLVYRIANEVEIQIEQTRLTRSTRVTVRSYREPIAIEL